MDQSAKFKVTSRVGVRGLDPHFAATGSVVNLRRDCYGKLIYTVQLDEKALVADPDGLVVALEFELVTEAYARAAGCQFNFDEQSMASVETMQQRGHTFREVTIKDGDTDRRIIVLNK